MNVSLQFSIGREEVVLVREFLVASISTRTRRAEPVEPNPLGSSDHTNSSYLRTDILETIANSSGIVRCSLCLTLIPSSRDFWKGMVPRL